MSQGLTRMDLIHKEVERFVKCCFLSAQPVILEPVMWYEVEVGRQRREDLYRVMKERGIVVKREK